MKINYLTKEIVEQCYVNLDDISEEVILHGRKTLEELFHDTHLLHAMDVEMKDFKLICSEDDKHRSSTDAENAKIVYEAMQNLTDSQAAEENLWAAYTLILQRDYMLWRWQPKSIKDVQNHFLFGFGRDSRRSLLRNGMARLWWIARLTMNTNLSDPYALTRYVCSNNTNVIKLIMEQAVFSRPEVMRGTIRAIYDLNQLNRREEEAGIPVEERQGVLISGEDIRKISQHMNMRAGTYLLDIFEEEEIYDMVQNFIRVHHDIS